MNLQDVLRYFHKNYPNRNVVLLPKEQPTEIICEADPSSNHPAYNRAIAAIQKSAAHYHKQAVETYTVLKGKVVLYIDKERVELREGESHVIQPQQIHHVESESFALVQVDSKPGWTADDHFLV
jgi:quercetin dioxygenase-like cupin family protein